MLHNSDNRGNVQCLPMAHFHSLTSVLLGYVYSHTLYSANSFE